MDPNKIKNKQNYSSTLTTKLINNEMNKIVNDITKMDKAFNV
jgi:hypothetical protein